MCAAPTSVAEVFDFAAALAAGWTDEDIEWEIKQERAAAYAHANAHGDNLEMAAPLWTESLALARAHFKANDPRLGTSLANRAHAMARDGQDAAADDTYREALRVWSGHGLWILAMPIERRARSSLFHMRMEARHREQYEATARERLRRFAQETRKAIADLAAGGAPPLRGYERWRAEKPAIFGETRKFLAACLLLVSRPS